jgi:hypothetical protein
MRFNKWTAMRICKRCYTSFIPTETQRKRHDTSYCAKCSEDMIKTDQEDNVEESAKKSILKKKK